MLLRCHVILFLPDGRLGFVQGSRGYDPPIGRLDSLGMISQSVLAVPSVTPTFHKIISFSNINVIANVQHDVPAGI